ncbi:hypothetical protein ACRBF7_004028 [Providencia stuartii]|uniref:hypothetical protein n=1 Tax=Providencia stuartii TaxID=588 RepID=UPI00076B513D|nr:hypothetical protein AL507_13840 [Providencia stuartii]HEM8215656.1 hypothetical protein [Providencia stuartii]
MVRIISEDNFICYIAINPPHDYFIRVDEINSNNLIKESSMFATTWLSQVDYDFIYDNKQNLIKIMRGDIEHWEND